MRNFNCLKNSVFIVFLTIIGLSLSNCTSMAVSLGKSLTSDFGIYDKSVPENQLCDLRFAGVIITSFDGNPVKWGKRADTNIARVKVSAGIHTIIFDWSTTDSEVTDRTRIGNEIKHTITTTTKSSRNITFADANLMAGHTYFITGGEMADGELQFWLLDQTSIPMGFYGDTVPKTPKKSKNPTLLEGSWENISKETFIFVGNTWSQTTPPMAGDNFSSYYRVRNGTFQIVNEKLLLHIGDLYRGALPVNERNRINYAPFEQVYNYIFSKNGDTLILELPWMLPETTYIKK